MNGRPHALLALLCLALWSCAKEPAPLEVLFNGCAELDGPRCLLTKPTPLILFVEAHKGPLVLQVGEVVREVTGEPRQGGVRLEITAHPSDGRLSLARPGEAESFSLELGPARRPAWVSEVEADLEARRLASAEARLNALAPAQADAEAAWALFFQAKLKFRADKLAQAAEAFFAAASRAAEADLPLLAARASNAGLSICWTQLRRPVAGGARLERWLSRSTEGQLRRHSLQALWLKAIGHPRPAMQALRAALRLTERVGTERERQLALMLEAYSLVALGRHQEARARYQALLAEPNLLSDRAVEVLNNLSLLQARAGLDGRWSLDRALNHPLSALYKATLLTNLAEAERQQGATLAAWEALAARPSIPEAQRPANWGLPEGWLRLGRGEAALAEGLALSALAQAQRAGLFVEGLEARALLRAAVLAQGDEAAASAQEQLVEAELGKQAAAIALGDGRGTWLGQATPWLWRWAGEWAAQGQVDRALALAWSAQRAAWASSGGPAPLGPGQVRLVFLPQSPGYLALVEREGRPPKAVPLPEVRASGRRDAHADAQDQTLGEAVFGPLRSEIAGAKQVALLAFGPLRRHALHALPLDGAPLLARFEVVYTLGLSASRRPPALAPLALVVADPLGALGQAQVEAKLAREGFSRGGLAVEARVGPPVTMVDAALATPPARPLETLALLSQVTLFAYLGQGRAGLEQRDGLSDALLFEDGPLSTQDLLALPHAPRLALLLACQTATGDEDALQEGLGLAQALVLKGSEAVVASLEDVPARSAFSRALFGLDWRSPALPKLAREAALRARALESHSDWPVWRVYVP